MKEQARSKKLDGDAARGRAGITMGAQHSSGGGDPQRPLEAGQPHGETTPANAFQKGDKKPWKGKCKGKGKGEKGGEGKGKGGQVNLNATSPGPQVVGSQSFSASYVAASSTTHETAQTTMRVSGPRRPHRRERSQPCVAYAWKRRTDSVHSERTPRRRSYRNRRSVLGNVRPNYCRRG